MIKSKILQSRKAQLGTLVKIILVLISAILLITAVVMIYAQVNAKGAIETCRISVLAQAETKIPASPTKGLTSPFSINCKKRYVKFFNNRVQEGNAPESTKPIEVNYNGRLTKNIPDLSSFVVNQVIAEEMRICYYEFGEGQVHTLNTGIATDACYVCSEISFDDKTKEFSGFMDYITKTYIKNEQMTYYEYLNKPSLSSVNWSMTADTLMKKYNYNYNRFSSSQSYAVVFAKSDQRWKVWLYQFWSGFNTEADNEYSVQVVPVDKLNYLCDMEVS
jgi:hypothetical protein